MLQPKDTLSWGKGCSVGHNKRLKPTLLATGIQQARWISRSVDLPYLSGCPTWLMQTGSRVSALRFLCDKGRALQGAHTGAVTSLEVG